MVEIIVIVVACLIVISVFGKNIYRKIKHLPTGDCEGCNHGKGLVDAYHKKYGNSCSNCGCCSKKK